MSIRGSQLPPRVALAALVVAVLVAAIGAMSAETPRASDPVPIDVMTFNIRTAIGRDRDNAWPHRKPLVAETIRRFEPHVVGLQEALDEQIEYLAGALPQYRWLGIDRGLNGGTGLSEYTPIFYRHDELSPIASGNFWLSGTPDRPTPRPTSLPDRDLGRLPPPNNRPSAARLQYPLHAASWSGAARFGRAHQQPHRTHPRG